MGLTLERVLHIKGVHVQLEHRKRAQLAFDVVDCWHWPTTDIVRDSTPTHCWPINDLYSGYVDKLLRAAVNELFECLQSVKNARGTRSGKNNVPRIDPREISFFIKRRRNCNFCYS